MLGALLQRLRPILLQVGKDILRGILFDFLYGCKSVTDATVDELDEARGSRDHASVQGPLCKTKRAYVLIPIAAIIHRKRPSAMLYV